MLIENFSEERDGGDLEKIFSEKCSGAFKNGFLGALNAFRRSYPSLKKFQQSHFFNLKKMTI
jgi:hypothetical protein